MGRIQFGEFFYDVILFYFFSVYIVFRALVIFF